MGQLQGVPGASQDDFDTLSDQIAKQQISVTWESGYAGVIYKSGDLCAVSFSTSSKALAADTWTNVGTIDAGYGSSSQTYFSGVDYDGNPVLGRVNGTYIQILSKTAITAKNLYMSVTYAI